MGVRAKARKIKGKTKATLSKVPGPSSNPATNLVILDVAMRGAAFIASRGVERALLRTRYQRQKAADIVRGRSFLQSLTATSAARVATRSVPGFLLVAGGLLAKAALDRSQSKRQAIRKGEQQLAKQAERGDDTAL